MTNKAFRTPYTYSYSGADCKAYAWFDWSGIGNIDDLFKVWKKDKSVEKIQKEKKTFTQQEIGNEPISPEEITLNQIQNLPNLHKYFDYREACDLFIDFFNKEIEVNANDREEEFKIGKYHLPIIEDYLIKIFKMTEEEASDAKKIFLEEIKVYSPQLEEPPIWPDLIKSFDNWLEEKNVNIKRDMVDPYFNKTDEIEFENIFDYKIKEFKESAIFRAELDKLTQSFLKENLENLNFEYLKQYINTIEDPIYNYYSTQLNEEDISLKPSNIVFDSRSNFFIFSFSVNENLFFNTSLNFLENKNCIIKVKTKEVFYNDSTEQNYLIERELDVNIFNKYIEIKENGFDIMVNAYELPENLFILDQNYLNPESYTFSFDVMNLVEKQSIFNELFSNELDSTIIPFLAYYNDKIEEYEYDYIKYENYLIYGNSGDIIDIYPPEFASEDLLYEKLDLLYVAMNFFDMKIFFEKRKTTEEELDIAWILDTRINMDKKYSYDNLYLDLAKLNYYQNKNLNDDIDLIAEEINEINFPTNSIKISKIKNIENLLNIAYHTYNLLRSGSLGKEYFIARGTEVEEMAYAASSRSVLEFFGFVLDPDKFFYTEEDLDGIVNEIELFKKENNIEVVPSIVEGKINVRIIEKKRGYEEIRYLLNNIEYDSLFKNIIFIYDDVMYNINCSEDKIIGTIESLNSLKEKSINILEYYPGLIEQLNTINLNDYNKWLSEKQNYENKIIEYNSKKNDITIYFEDKEIIGEPYEVVDEALKSWVMGTTHLKSLVTLSLSIHDAKAPVRRLGHVTPVGFTKAIRTIAGTMVFLIIEDHPLRELMARDPSNYIFGDREESKKNTVTREFSAKNEEDEFSGYYWSYDQDSVGVGRNIEVNNYTDRIPAFLSSLISPFNLLMHYQTEVKAIETGKASMLIKGIEITGESIVTSVNDMVTEVVVQFVAQDVYQFNGSGATEQDIIDSFTMRLSNKDNPITYMKNRR